MIVFKKQLQVSLEWVPGPDLLVGVSSVMQEQLCHFHMAQQSSTEQWSLTQVIQTVHINTWNISENIETMILFL